jgi:hypothetical protein
MPRPKRYASSAQRQAAYRERIEQARQGRFDADYLPPLPSVDGIPGTTRWRQAVQLALQLLNTVQEEMDDYYSSRSETWQESEPGEEFDERKQAVDEAHDAVSSLADSF